MSRHQIASFSFVIIIFSTSAASAGSQPPQTSNIGQQCVACHTTVTPNVVSDWRQSKHHECNMATT